MTDEQAQGDEARIDFFISYTGKDQPWAEWIAMQLEEATYRVIIQAWDFRPGTNFVAEMDTATKHADRTLLVLSAAYLTSDDAFAEWVAAFRHDPKGKQGRVLPVRIQKCEVEGLLGSIVYIDLVGRDEAQAHEHLLAGIQHERAKPTNVPFPVSPSGPLADRPLFPGSLPPIWNIPYPQNPLFTGRQELLTQLAATLQTEQPTALSQPQAITGLGGIGKTQLALEYAYHYRGDYQAVLWAQADTRENLTSSYLVMATLLNLPEKNEQESARIITAVKDWLQHNTNWLLILDNADELTPARDFLPPSLGGQVLLTTRAQATGHFAHRLEVDTLSTELGALFLLRRSGLLPVNATLEQAKADEQARAREICEEVGGLPLALDQAGAYIEETGCRLAEYQRLYQHRRADLLAKRGGQPVDDHPLPVATTWSLSFQNVEQKNPAAADLLRLCTFLASDAIPEEIITKGCLPPSRSFFERIWYFFSRRGKTQGLLRHLAGDAFAFDQAIEVLRAYSLISRTSSSGADSQLSVHRLVQATLKDQMDEQDRQQWTQRAVRAVNAAFPKVEHQTWPQCDRLLPHALLCAELIAQEQMTAPEATRLLNQTGYYLNERARYAQAEPLYLRALAIREQQLGAQHPDTATSLNNLATLYQAQGKCVEAEPLLQRALAIREQQLGPGHPHTASSLNNLAGLYWNQGKYEQAEPLYQRALAICEQQLGALHPDTAGSLNNLAALYRAQEKYEQAEPLLVRALAIDERALGPQHPTTQRIRANYARLLRTMGRDAEAAALDQP